MTGQYTPAQKAAVEKETELLREAGDEDLRALNEHSARKRLAWYKREKAGLGLPQNDPLQAAYELLVVRFGVQTREMPVREKTETRILFHSMNFCPTLEACRLLGRETCQVCRLLNEEATDRLVKQVDGRLRFGRNYEKLRPVTAYCEEMILFED